MIGTVVEVGISGMVFVGRSLLIISLGDVMRCRSPLGPTARETPAAEVLKRGGAFAALN
jgi:hypothetical protein